MRREIALGMAIGGMFATSLRAAAVIIIGSFAFQVHYTIIALPELLAVFFLAIPLG